MEILSYRNMDNLPVDVHCNMEMVENINDFSEPPRTIIIRCSTPKSSPPCDDLMLDDYGDFVIRMCTKPLQDSSAASALPGGFLSGNLFPKQATRMCLPRKLDFQEPMYLRPDIFKSHSVNKRTNSGGYIQQISKRGRGVMYRPRC